MTEYPGIKFGEPTISKNKELIRTDDNLNVDPSWFDGVRQSDGYSCAYFVMSVLDRMQRGDSADPQSKLIRSLGLDKLMKLYQSGKTKPLEAQGFRTELRALAGTESHVFTLRSDLSFAKEEVTNPQVMVEALRRGYGIAIEDHTQGHLVFAFGISKDGSELVAWDPLFVSVDTKSKNARIRRISVVSPNIYMWGGLKLDEKFKDPK